MASIDNKRSRRAIVERDTHSLVSLYEVFLPDEVKALLDRFEFVYTLKHRIWLTIAEIELNLLTGQCLNRTIDEVEIVRKEATAC